MSRVIFSQLPAGSFDVLRLALDAANLPSDDIIEPGRRFYELADEGGPIGFVGIEGEGANRLLRSVVVLPSRKRKGYGGLLVAHAEAVPRQDGAQRLHLLTRTEAAFFSRRGYHHADRSAAPEPIRSTARFTGLCPASAAYLVKDIA